MSNKLSLHALTIAGIIAVSSLPAFAADMVPATPAPGAAVQSDSKASVSGTVHSPAVGTNTKADAKIVPADKSKSVTADKAKTVTTDKAKTVSKDASKDMKAATTKTAPVSKDKAPQVQTAKLPASTSAAPATPATPVPAPTATVNGNIGTSVQH